ncbi:MAG: hypothetical protein HY651_09455 [Acidobacteria bacterium]|nr:hypothetical protein [Acidobacteriota bacterium]
MKRRRLWLLNAVLAAFVILMVARIAAVWRRGNERYARLTERSAAVGSVLMVPGDATPQMAGGEVVAKNLFTPDRNNDRPQETQAQTAGPLPIVIGTMRLGADYEALMSEAKQPGSERFRRVKTGEQVGAYTVVEIRDEAVVVEFQGQKTVVNVYQSAKAVMRAAGNPAPPPLLQSAPVVETVASPVPAAQPSAPAAAQGAANAGVSTASPFPGVRVTIEGNRRRFERDTAFGPQVWYEDITK